MGQFEGTKKPRVIPSLNLALKQEFNPRDQKQTQD